MLRTDLLKTLETVAPALAPDNLIPILSHFWFKGDTVMAFNDKIAIETTCKTDFIGALPGNILLSLLKNSRAKEVSFVQDGEGVVIKAASSKLKLACIKPEKFLFEMPKSGGVAVDIPKDRLIGALKDCLRSVSDDTSHPEHLGVTVEPGPRVVDFYSTNNATLSHVKVPVSETSFKRAILPTMFCKQLIDMGKDPVKLFIMDDHALALSGRTVLFGRLIECSKPLDFAHVVAHHIPKTWKPLQIPTKLQLILERATIITDSPQDQTATEVTVKDGMMKFYSQSGFGEVTDTMQVPGHPDVSARIRCKFLKVGIEDFKEFLITDSCAIMGKGDKIYFVAVTQS